MRIAAAIFFGLFFVILMVVGIMLANRDRRRHKPTVYIDRVPLPDLDEDDDV